MNNKNNDFLGQPFSDLAQQIIASGDISSDNWSNYGSRLELYFNAKKRRKEEEKIAIARHREKINKEVESMRRKLIKYSGQFDGVPLGDNIISRIQPAPEVPTLIGKGAFVVLLCPKDVDFNQLRVNVYDLSYMYYGLFGVYTKKDSSTQTDSSPIYGFRITKGNFDCRSNPRSGDYEYLHDNYQFVLNKGAEIIADLAIEYEEDLRSGRATKRKKKSQFYTTTKNDLVDEFF